MTRVVLAGGRELDAGTAAGRALVSCGSVAVVTLAAAYRRPDALLTQIGAWADALSVEHAVVRAVRRSDSLNPDVSEPIADCDGVLVLDGSPAHFVGAVKATPLLEAIVAAHGRGADVVWSGAAAAAVCTSMVDDRGGALTVGLGLHGGIVVAAGWEGWPRDRRRRPPRNGPRVGFVHGPGVGRGRAVDRLAPGAGVLVEARGLDRARRRGRGPSRRRPPWLWRLPLERCSIAVRHEHQAVNHPTCGKPIEVRPVGGGVDAGEASPTGPPVGGSRLSRRRESPRWSPSARSRPATARRPCCPCQHGGR